jgi:hypothetical protein
VSECVSALVNVLMLLVLLLVDLGTILVSPARVLQRNCWQGLEVGSLHQDTACEVSLHSYCTGSGGHPSSGDDEAVVEGCL